MSSLLFWIWFWLFVSYTSVFLRRRRRCECIGKCNVEFVCILHRLRNEIMVGKRSKLDERAFVQNQKRNWKLDAMGRSEELQWFSLAPRNIPINMHATTINNYAHQNETRPILTLLLLPSHSQCFGWSSDCNWNDGRHSRSPRRWRRRRRRPRHWRVVVVVGLVWVWFWVWVWVWAWTRTRTCIGIIAPGQVSKWVSQVNGWVALARSTSLQVYGLLDERSVTQVPTIMRLARLHNSSPRLAHILVHHSLLVIIAGT